MTGLEVSGTKNETLLGEWSKTTRLKGREYALFVTRNIDWEWEGTVILLGDHISHVWGGPVRRSISCRGLVKKSGLLG